MNGNTPAVKETRSTCPYCGVGCGVIIESAGDRITGVRGDPEHPANFGRLCTKGSTLHLTAEVPVTLQSRLLHPQRRHVRGSAPLRVGWGEAIDVAAETFHRVISEHGPDAVGFYISGQLLTEDYYVFNKLAKGLIGTNNVDTNSRLCMSSAVAGYKATLGADAPPTCYDDVDHAETLFIAGSNTAYAHPVLYRRIEEARRARPSMRVIVADPRRTETAQAADLHLPILPGTDVALFNGMLHVMLWEDLIDRGFIGRHTQGFDDLRNRVRDFPPKEVAQTCGIPEESLVKAARWFAGMDTTDGPRRPTLSLYCQGLNQSSSGTMKNAALINLHLATGQIGKPGAGPFSLTGQPNAMGGREVGGLANLLSAHRDLSNPEHRAEVASLWQVDDVPARPGLTAVEMFEAAADGQVKALWIACTNPAQSMPDQATVRRALQRAEFVVVQEAFATTATCEFADLLLPATTWGEKEGTVTNSERRISRVRAAVPAPGEARNDWSIATEFAQQLERRLRPGAPSLFPYRSADHVWNEHRESTRGRDLDITGLSYAQLEERPAQWPCPEGTSVGRARLYEDGRFATPDGRARFVDAPHTRLAEPRDARYPFSLNTGRLRDQWHGMSRTGLLGRLFGHVPEPSVEMHVQDLARLRLADGDLVHVTSRRGSLVLPVQASTEVLPSQVFIAMHWGAEHLSGRSSTGERMAGVNALTTPACCPTSRQPELKHCAVKILKAEMPWHLLGMAWLPADKAPRVRDQLRDLMGSFAFAACVPFGRERSGLLFRAADYEAGDDALLARIEELLGLQGREVLRYADRRRGQRRSLRLVRDLAGASASASASASADTRLEAALLTGEGSSRSWLKTVLEQQLAVQSYGRLLLSPGASAPVAMPRGSREVCSCVGVSEEAIVAEASRCQGAPEARLGSVQGALQCGTRCGSCVPEIKRLIRTSLSVAPAA